MYSRYFEIAAIIRRYSSRGQAQLQYRRGQIRAKENHSTVSSDADGSGLHRYGHGSFFWLRLWLGFGNQLLPIAAFFEASMDGADLGALLDDERRFALRAWLGDGHMG